MMIISPAKLHRETIASSPTTVPEELIAEVLSSLKVKSLLRFKCVNKSWNSVISDPFFVKMHLIKSSLNPHMIISRTYLSSTSDISLHNPFILRSLLENPFIDLFPIDSKYKLMHKYGQIIGSCNGLTCYGSEKTGFYLRNPATRWSSQKLESFNHSKTRFNYSFGYDNLTDKYKVVAFLPNKVRVLTWGENVWRNIQSFPTYPYRYYTYREEYADHVNAGVYLSNTLNWFALRGIRPYYHYDHRDLSVQQFMIISLDLGQETYTRFQFPHGFDQVPVVPPILCRLMECLCFFHYSRGSDFVIWQMKEFGVQKSWTKLLRFDYHNLVQRGSSEIIQLFPLHVFENGDTLILSSNRKQLICYNSRDNRVEKKTTIINSICLSSFNVNHYVESLLESKILQ